MLASGSAVLSDKFTGSVMAAVVGDAIGVPVETMTGCEIRAHFGEITSFISPKFNPHVFSELSDLTEGAWSDDTQRLRANMKAFIQSQGIFDMDAFAENYLEEYRYGQRGWGRSCRNSGARLDGGMHWSESGEPDGAGNGVIIGIGVIGLWQSVINQLRDVFLANCITYGRMTHLGTPAIVGGAVHALAVASLATRHSHEFDAIHFLNHFFNIAKHLEDHFDLPLWPDKISDALKLIINKLKSGDLFSASPADIAASWFGGGTAYAPYSFGLSYALFVRNPLTFECVFDAVNAGGDTDSNACIAGSLIGALNGSHVISENLIRDVEESENLQNLAKDFFNAVVSYKNLRNI